MTYLLHSIAGIGALLAAFIMVGVSIYSGRSQDASQKAQWWTSLVVAAGYTLLSVGFSYRSGEHHETLRSSLIIWTGILVLSVSFVCSRVQWKKQGQNLSNRAV